MITAILCSSQSNKPTSAVFTTQERVAFILKRPNRLAGNRRACRYSKVSVEISGKIGFRNRPVNSTPKPINNILPPIPIPSRKKKPGIPNNTAPTMTNAVQNRSTLFYILNLSAIYPAAGLENRYKKDWLKRNMPISRSNGCPFANTNTFFR
jgi:hypothetical protein